MDAAPKLVVVFVNPSWNRVSRSAVFRRCRTAAGSFQAYVVSRDGQRFLVDTVVEEPSNPITIVLNWKPPTD